MHKCPGFAAFTRWRFCCADARGLVGFPSITTDGGLGVTADGRVGLHRSVRGWLAVTICAVLLGGLWVAWLHGAASLIPYAGGINTTWSSAPARVRLLIGAEVQPKAPRSGHLVLDLHAIRPRVTVNTAGATIQVVLCHVANPDEGLGTGTLKSQRDVCASLRPFRPGSVDLGFPATEVAYLITAEHSGRLQVEGADVSYSSGFRSGAQRAGSGFSLKASGSTGR